jgi:energy-coupling factor transporter transmembrane protein EcfT
MNKTPKTTLLILGLISQILGLLCFYTIWLMIFAVAFFIIGTILIFISRKKWYLKLLCITPMLYSISIIINALTFEKYIIPEKFRGVVYVITDKDLGERREYDFFTRVFRIPESGILFTKFSQEPGYNNRQFYQIDSLGNLKEINILDYRNYIEKWVVNPPKTEPSRDSFAVFTPDLEFDFNEKKYRMVFTVGRYKETNVWNYIPKEKIDSLRSLMEK